MSIRVEFFGIPRQRSGVECALVFTAGKSSPRTLAEVLRAVGGRFPRFAADCLSEDGLQPGYIACLDGRSFVTDGRTPVRDGCTVMILSADAGG